MAEFIKIPAEQFDHNPFTLIEHEWMLITAEKEGKVNTMTANWGGLGEIWYKRAAYIVVRPHRYTKEFLDAADTFSLTFFDESYRKTLSDLGEVSGRDEDKIAKSGLTVVHSGNTPYFEQARLALICKKVFAQPFEPQCVLDEAVKQRNYVDNDYHTLYIGFVEEILQKA